MSTKARQGNFKLTLDQAVNAKKMLKTGERTKWIAAEMGVSYSCISLIKRNKTWKGIVCH